MTATVIRPMSVKLDAGTRTRFEHLAESRRRTPHWMLREAVAQYIEREEKREAFRQDTLNAREEYRSTGRHVTADAADAWLEQLAEGNGVEPPEFILVVRHPKEAGS